MDKQKANKYLPDLFRILHSNMRLIAPTNNTYDYDYEIWYSYKISEIQKEHRQIVLMCVESKLVGYFQYCMNRDTNSFMMEDIQIVNEFRGTGLFSSFYKWLMKQLPKDILYVEAYAHKNNDKSQAILQHLGLIRSGENKNGISYYYKGKYADLLSKYS